MNIAMVQKPHFKKNHRGWLVELSDVQTGNSETLGNIFGWGYTPDDALHDALMRCSLISRIAAKSQKKDGHADEDKNG